MGLGKPVFLVADDKEHLASSLLSLPFVVASPYDVETLRFHMEAFLPSLALPRKTSTVSKRPPRFYGGGEPVPIQRTDSSPEAQVERRVAAAFRRAGANVTVSPQIAEDSEADMIIWLPDPDLGAGGPLLVEVKSRATEAFPAGGVQQIRRLLDRSHLHAAVLVTNAPDPGLSGRIMGGAFVYTVSILELERLAEAGKLGQELKRVRNRLAHGAA
jgi:Restriction endonuclease